MSRYQTHSLKVTTIPTLATEIIKGRSNLSQLATQWNCMAVTAHGVARYILETSNNNSPWLILPNPRSAQTRDGGLLKSTRRSFRWKHVQLISMFQNQNPMVSRLTIGDKTSRGERNPRSSGDGRRWIAFFFYRRNCWRGTSNWPAGRINAKSRRGGKIKSRFLSVS